MQGVITNGARHNSKWLQAHCDCHMEEAGQDGQVVDNWVVPCGLHEFAEKAAKFLNEFRQTDPDDEVLDMITKLLDKYGLLGG